MKKLINIKEQYKKIQFASFKDGVIGVFVSLIFTTIFTSFVLFTDKFFELILRFVQL